MTDFITEPARHVPVIHRTDVLVVGSGPGGLAAARAGRPTRELKSRSYSALAAMAAISPPSGSSEGLAWYRHEATLEANGIGRECEERAKAMGLPCPKASR